MCVQVNCPECNNSYPLGRNVDMAKRLCSSCARKKREDAAKTELANDLVRGKPK